jgi:ADP-ribosylglycohydrolase
VFSVLDDSVIQNLFCLGVGPAARGFAPGGRGLNGSIMRLAPVVIRFASAPEEAIAMAAASSRTTHAAPPPW